MVFSYPPHGLSIQFLSIPKNFHISDMYDFKACQTFHSSHLWNRGIWHWHMCSHVTLIAVCHPFSIMRELPCCFFIFKLCLSVSSTEQTAQLRRKRIALQTELTVSIIVFVKCPWFIFQSLMAFYSEGLSCYHCKKIAVKFINFSASMALDCHLFRGSRIHTPRTTIHSQLIFQAMCEFSRPKPHKNKFPCLYHF